MPRLGPRRSRPLGTYWRLRRLPPGWRSMRIAVAAMLAYVLSLPLTNDKAPVLAPLAALLVMHATVRQSLVSGARRVLSVAAGVILAAFLSSEVGLTWWSVGLAVFVALLLGSALRLGEWVTEVPVTALLVLAVSSQRDFAIDRVYETLIGAAVGVLVNVLLVPPIFVQSAGDALVALGREEAHLLHDVANDLRNEWSEATARKWTASAFELDRKLNAAREALAQAEDSLRYNPRKGNARVADESLRSGLAALEHAEITIRGLLTSLLDRVRLMDEANQPSDELRLALADVLDRHGTAVRIFSDLVGADVNQPWQAEESLHRALNRARQHPEVLVQLLATDSSTAPVLWRIHGSMLTHLDRLLHEIDPSTGTQAGGARRENVVRDPWTSAMRRVIRQRSAASARQRQG